MTEQEITQARADVDQLDIEELRCGVMLQLLKIESLTAERDALKDAAKLASRALNRIDAADIRLDTGERLSITKAITALKAVLK